MYINVQLIKLWFNKSQMGLNYPKSGLKVVQTGIIIDLPLEREGGFQTFIAIASSFKTIKLSKEGISSPKRVYMP
ncbi:hypothetical protein [Rossellomorea yichunensis]|jgi:hypothetical protein|uniref:hypothetical protein n=1 Tax=Rossellomorea yichunensis TaxID=3077331 RepID=UPI0028E08D64|nr:hypothetical protein [Rossellomorea sp. YC4-1]MDT9025527.1 hypothetical protein [Rossellomorea sp. YC4-1]